MKVSWCNFLGTFAALAILTTGSAFADALERKTSPAEVLAATGPDDWAPLNQDDLVYIELERGQVVVLLSRQLAQGHVAQFKALAREGFYDGLSFYRVIDGFVAQGGDVLETRTVKEAEQSLAAEFVQSAPVWHQFMRLPDNDGYAPVTGFVDGLPVGLEADRLTVWHLHCTGAIAMARDVEKDSAGTEFYITLQPQRYLDRNLTVFGRVIQGMEHIQALRRVAPAETEEDDLGERILSVRVGSDMPENGQLALEMLLTNTPTFSAYVEARRNRPESFFYYRPDYINVCDINVPVRAVAKDQDPQ